MNVVFSFCEHDREMATALARHIECLGGVGEHEVFLLYPENVNAREIMGPLKESFLAVHIVTYPPMLNGWPDGPNQCFQVACETMLPKKEPWLWLEADCVVTTPKWLDIIQKEYQWHGRPVLGVKNDSFAPNGKVDGQHVTGVAVYPHDLLKLCPSLKTMTKATKAYREGGTLPPAFDCYIAPWAVKNCAETSVIRHYWKSRNFRESLNGTVYCDFQVPYGVSNIVDMDAVLIHGAKDFSLLDIVQKRLTTAIPAAINTGA